MMNFEIVFEKKSFRVLNAHPLKLEEKAADDFHVKTEILDLGEQVIKVRNVLSIGVNFNRKFFKAKAELFFAYHDEFDCLRTSSLRYGRYNSEKLKQEIYERIGLLKGCMRTDYLEYAKANGLEVKVKYSW
jgi:hypothetical protein